MNTIVFYTIVGGPGKLGTMHLLISPWVSCASASIPIRNRSPATAGKRWPVSRSPCRKSKSPPELHRFVGERPENAIHPCRAAACVRFEDDDDRFDCCGRARTRVTDP